MLKSKKAQDIVSILIVIFAFILILIFGSAYLSQRECSNNGQCSEYEYCGFDYSCHSFEVRETRIVESANTKVAWILGILIVGAAIFLRFGKNGKAYPKDRSIRDFIK